MHLVKTQKLKNTTKLDLKKETTVQYGLYMQQKYNYNVHDMKRIDNSNTGQYNDFPSPVLRFHHQ